MTPHKQNGSLYDVAAPLLTAGLALLISLYVCILQPNVYAYFLPVFAALLLVSIHLFNRANKVFCKEGAKNDAAAFFYKGCVFMYFAFSLYLLSVSVIFFTVYSSGGYFIVWSCMPFSLLCLLVSLQAVKGLKEAQTNSQPVNTDVI